MHNNEWQQAGKTLIVILGACAAGKSTLTRAICGEASIDDAVDFVCFDRRSGSYARERAKYVLGKSGVVVAGNWKSTSDAISKPREPRAFVRIADHLTPEESADLIREEIGLWKLFSRPAA